MYNKLLIILISMIDRYIIKYIIYIFIRENYKIVKVIMYEFYYKDVVKLLHCDIESVEVLHSL